MTSRTSSVSADGLRAFILAGRVGRQLVRVEVANHLSLTDAVGVLVGLQYAGHLQTNEVGRRSQGHLGEVFRGHMGPPEVIWSDRGVAIMGRSSH